MDKVTRPKELTKQLNQYRDSYYNNSVSEISDQEYDNLFDELKQLEEETNIIMANSPTHTVGYEVKSKLEKVKHSHLMLSLDKTKSVDDLKKFAGDKDCLLMCKMDGLTILLTYENGELVKAETRGDGEIGEDVTHNAKVFENVPLHIDYMGHFETEGEAIITYEDFEKINSKLPENEKYKNPRNLVSGSVRQLDSNIAAQRHIKFIAWKLPITENTDDGTYPNFYCMNYRFRVAEKLGFEIVPNIYIKNWENHYDEYIESLKYIAKKDGYPIDGLVMTYNDIAYGESLGTTGHHPKHSLAFKFYDEEVTTTLKDIEWSIGKTGELTPVAIFDDVELEGTIVSRASLHNISICKDLQLGIGDKITVYKANQIIPQIRDNFTKSNDFVIPSICPICKWTTEIIKNNNTEVLSCTNPDCKGKLLGKLSHFVSKNAINIEGMSEATLQLLVERGWVKSFKDLYNLKENQIYLWKYHTVGFGEKSVEKLLENIEKSRNTTLDRFIYGLCIPLIGRTTSKEIAKACANGDINQFITIMSLEGNQPFIGLEGFGKEMCNSIVHWWVHNRQSFYELIEEFNFREQDSNRNAKQVLYKKVFVITGSLRFYKNREELAETIERNGGKVSGSVSTKTSYLINNDVTSTSGKNKKAHDLGIPIINEGEFIQMITS